MSSHLNIGEAIVQFSVEVANPTNARVRLDVITTATHAEYNEENEASRILKASGTRPAVIVRYVFVHGYSYWTSSMHRARARDSFVKSQPQAPRAAFAVAYELDRKRPKVKLVR